MKAKFTNSIVQREINALYKSRQLTPNHIKTLYSVLGNTLVVALNLIDRKKVTKVQSRSGRFYFKLFDIKSLYPKEEGNEYMCMLGPKKHCSCTRFTKEVIIEKSLVMCPHLLAVILSDALGAFELEMMENLPFAEEYYNWRAM